MTQHQEILQRANSVRYDQPCASDAINVSKSSCRSLFSGHFEKACIKDFVPNVTKTSSFTKRRTFMSSKDARTIAP